MRRTFARFVALIAATLLLSGCDDVVGALYSLDIEIRGPRELPGEWTEPSWSDAVEVEAGFRCEPELRFFVTGGSDQRYAQVRWTRMVVTRYALNDALMRTPIGEQRFDSEARDLLLPFLANHGWGDSRPIPVVGESVPFRYRLSVDYYDTDSFKDGSASFTGTCVAQ